MLYLPSWQENIQPLNDLQSINLKVFTAGMKIKVARSSSIVLMRMIKMILLREFF